MIFSGRRSGASFHRAIHYVLHDKQGDTADRVGFVHTINLGTTAYAREMQTTVDAARAIQARHRLQTGQRAQASGRTPERVCYSFSLSWHPSENPSPELMLKTAKAALKELGLEQHQAVISEHVERGHRHLHVVCSLINPKTGRIAAPYNDLWKMRSFCEAYEKEHGVHTKAKTMDKKPLPRRAAKAADEIRAKKERAVQSIRSRHATAKVRRAEELNDSWKSFKAQKQDITDRYKILIAKVWSRSGPELSLEPKPSGSLFPRGPEWIEVAKALKTHGPLPEKQIKGRLPSALDGILDRKARSDHLKSAMRAELGQLSLLHHRREERLKKNHENERETEKKDWANLASNSKRVWREWAEEYNIGGKTKAEPVRDKFNKPAKKEEMTVSGYADDYIAWRGRDSKDHEQFAANNAAAIEKEFAQRFEQKKYRTEISETEAIAQFKEDAHQVGIVLRGDPEPDGKPHYTNIEGSKKKSGEYAFYKNHDGTFGGYVKNYKEGTYKPFHPKGERVAMTGEQIQKSAQEAEARKTQKAKEDAAIRDNAASASRLVWERSVPANPDHPYLRRKGIEPHGIRECREDIFMKSADPEKPAINLKNSLIIPRYTMDGKLRSIQAIRPNGYKLNYTAAQKNDTAYVIGHIENGKPISVLEGYATGESVFEAMNHPVVIAFDKGNIGHITKALRTLYPDSPIYNVADMDHWTFTTEGFEKAGRPDKKEIPGNDPRWQQWRESGFLQNPGLESATTAAQENDATLVTPPISPDNAEKMTDMNDVHKAFGIEAVRSAFPEPEHTLENTGPEIEYDGYER